MTTPKTENNCCQSPGSPGKQEQKKLTKLKLLSGGVLPKVGLNFSMEHTKFHVKEKFNGASPLTLHATHK